MLFSTEKSFLEVAPRNLLLDGTTEGRLSVAGACQLKVGQKFTLKSNTQPPIQVKITQFIDELTFFVGAHNKSVNDRVDVSAYLVADGANIFACKQPRPSIPPDDAIRGAYSEEPAMAFRNLLVDECGKALNAANPLPITGSITVSSNLINIAAQVTKISINTATWTLLERSGSTSPTGAGALASRKTILIQNLTGQDIIIQYDNGTIDNAISITIPDGIEKVYDYGPNIKFYAKSTTSGVDIVYEEGS